MVALEHEDWTESVKLSTTYLKEMKEDDSRLPRLRYIYLYAAAGKVSEGKMSYGQLERSLKDFVGKDVILPYQYIAREEEKGGGLNFIRPERESKKRLFIAATNEDGTTIHAFEYIQLKEDFDPAGHEGQLASVSGVIDSIEPNPNKSLALVMRIRISNGVIKLRG